MEYNVFSYTNNSKSNIVLVIEPWILIYDIPSKSTIKFYYSSQVSWLRYRVLKIIISMYILILIK